MCAQCEGPDRDRYRSSEVPKVAPQATPHAVDIQSFKAQRIRKRFSVSGGKASWLTLDEMTLWVSIFDSETLKRVPSQAEINTLLALEKRCFGNNED